MAATRKHKTVDEDTRNNADEPDEINLDADDDDGDDGKGGDGADGGDGDADDDGDDHTDTGWRLGACAGTLKCKSIATTGESSP